MHDQPTAAVARRAPSSSSRRPRARQQASPPPAGGDPLPLTGSEAFERARSALAAAEAAGEKVTDQTGRRRSPVTFPEYRLGRPPPNKGKRYPAEVLTVDEVQRLLDAVSVSGATGVRTRALIVLLWRGGLRIAEALALYPKDVDLDLRMVTVLHGKGDKRRVSAIDDTAVSYLREWEKVRATLEIPPGALLFCTAGHGGLPPGRPLRTAGFRNQLKLYARKAGITKRVHPHGLRHTHAFELATDGIPVHVIKAQLGHESLEMTQHYIDHLAPVQLLRAIHQRSAPHGAAPPLTTRVATSQGQLAPTNGLEPPAQGFAMQREVVAPVAHELGQGRGERGVAKTRIMELVKANGGRMTQGQLRRALRLPHHILLDHLHGLVATRELVRGGKVGHGGHASWVWMLPPLKVVFRQDPRLEFSPPARKGEGAPRVLEAITRLGGRASQAQLAGELGITPRAVAHHCQLLRAQGKLERGGLDKATSNRGSSIWRLPSPHRWIRPTAGGRLAFGVATSSTRRLT